MTELHPMRAKLFLYLALLSLLPLSAYATTSVQGHPVVQSFHLGPEDAGEDACDGGGCRYYNPPTCPYCVQCNYQHWCPYCGFCPMYDELTSSNLYQQYRADWPSRRDDSWVEELEGY